MFSQMLHKDVDIAQVFNANISASSCTCAMGFILAPCSLINLSFNPLHTPRKLILRGLESCGWDPCP